MGPILIVEDIPHILELLEVTLKFKGYDVVTARNGDEALDQIAAESPILILTDILMPKLDGRSPRFSPISLKSIQSLFPIRLFTNNIRID
jgi:CheY-like chemotaxis protein